MTRRGQYLLEDPYACAIAELCEGLWQAQQEYT